MGSDTAARILGGKYRLVRKLDQGGMGSVWYAEHLVLNSPVAVKLLELENLEGGPSVQRFLREAQTAASLRSPHVVQVLDYGVEENTPFIVMELLEGESLAQRLRRVGRLTPRETERVIAQVARAIGRAHDAGVIHRDLKPANVFVVRDADLEHVKVLDFGIAKATAGAGDHTQSGTFLGTPAYASPEQVQGSRALDHRTDIWSLGVIAFECLLGSRPFVGDTFGAVVLAVCSKPLPVPSSAGAVPQGFDAWFAKACARHPEARFASARQAAEALSQLCGRALTDEVSAMQPLAAAANAHAPTVPDWDEASIGAAPTTNASSRVGTSSSRGWLFPLAGGLVLASLALVSLVVLLNTSGRPLEPPPAPAPRTAVAPTEPPTRRPVISIAVPDAGSRAAAESKPKTLRLPRPLPQPTLPPKARAKPKAKAVRAESATSAPKPPANESEFDLGL
jgi:eukaryotic-like serine/threonine-protein kinase